MKEFSMTYRIAKNKLLNVNIYPFRPWLIILITVCNTLGACIRQFRSMLVKTRTCSPRVTIQGEPKAIIFRSHCKVIVRCVYGVPLEVFQINSETVVSSRCQNMQQMVSWKRIEFLLGYAILFIINTISHRHNQVWQLLLIEKQYDRESRFWWLIIEPVPSACVNNVSFCSTC